MSVSLCKRPVAAQAVGRPTQHIGLLADTVHPMVLSKLLEAHNRNLSVKMPIYMTTNLCAVPLACLWQ
jgi:hypothetical protein